LQQLNKTEFRLSLSASFSPRSLLVTGGAGFIGSNFVRSFIEEHPDARVTVLDKLTYAGNLENLADLEGRFSFIKADICDADAVRKALADHAVDAVVHFAAESHVDRSILGPMIFTQTNVLGTHVMLEESRRHGVERFIHVSTDEVYGSLGPKGAFTESSSIDPTSPYAASKAASDLVVLAYAKTFGFPAIITRCSNNYGPWQFPEKLIPLMLINAMNDKALPVYGDGMNVRDWIHTRDHSAAVMTVLAHGVPGEVYNIGSSNEWPNIDIVKLILRTLGKPESLITFVKDRLAHDRRYAIDSSKIERELGWKALIPFDQGIAETIAWYQDNERWWKRVMSGEYVAYYEMQYGKNH
jgi:dTDP-glucose 4,6-dehydratase